MARASRVSVPRRASSALAAIVAAVVGWPGPGQHGAAIVDQGDVLRLQPRHGGGRQVQDGLRPLAIETRGTGHRQHDAGLRLLPVTGERFALAHHNVHAGGTHALDHTDAARQLPFHGPGLVQLLLETAGGQSVTAVEDLVPDRAARWQPVLGQQ